MFDNHWQPYAWRPPAKWAIRWKITSGRKFDGTDEGWVHRYVHIKGTDKEVLAQNATDKIPMTLYDSFESALADVIVWVTENDRSDRRDSLFTIVNVATGETIPGEVFV